MRGVVSGSLREAASLRARRSRLRFFSAMLEMSERLGLGVELDGWPTLGEATTAVKNDRPREEEEGVGPLDEGVPPREVG